MNQLDRGIVIVGFMGAGKTTVARELARKVSFPMIDLDEFIVEHEGQPIAEIFDHEGETHFRSLESAALRALLTDENRGVLALGGGAWTIPENRELVMSAGWTSVWLDTPFELCWSRIAASPELRPLATEQTKARALYDERRAAYQLAQQCVSGAAGLSLDAIVATIMGLAGGTTDLPH
jgi:shikimate kinase